MARLSLLDRFRKRPAEGTVESGPPTPARAPRLPPPGVLRRERRALVRTREERIRDLGGLMLEMYRRDQFKQDLLVEQCLEVISIEERLREIDGLLEASADARRSGVGVRCTCGAPIQWGSHFCANCGRPVGEEPVVACPNCGTAIPADAQFCAHCGTPVPESARKGDGQQADGEQTMYQQQPERSEPWEG
ncbi:MAG TPA: zinc ribbon domain-containing protein [Gaiellaceae bacterium]|nr:zinc ribbon domain-containing protein [Gaiellaceae bacterium]